MSNEHGFQFTPFGILPLNASVPQPSAEFVAPSVVHRQSGEQTSVSPALPQLPAARPVVGSAQARLDPSRPLTGGQLMAVAKARVKELDKILRQVPALEAERAGLQRLIDAARISKRIGHARTGKRVNGTTHQ